MKEISSAMASLASLFLLFIMVSASPPPILPSADSAAQEGFRTEITRRDSELPSSERIQKAIQRSYLRAKLLSSNGKVDDIGKLSLHDAGGGFTMEVLIGTPPQSLQLVLDTGSDLVWVKCTSHTKWTEYFHTSLSSTFQPLSCNNGMCQYISHECTSNSCEYEYEYGGGSQTSGLFSTETITLHLSSGTSMQFPKVAFGCGDENNGFDYFDGIVGFGQGPISFTSQLSSSINSKFSYCLRSETNTSSPLFFGSAAEIRNSGVQSTPLIPNSLHSSFYFVNLTGIRVAGYRIPIPYHAFQNSGGTILDSGTTVTFLPNSVYYRVRMAFSSRIHLPAVDGSLIGLDLCYDTSSTTSYSFPSLVLEFQNAQMTPPQENYFISLDPDDNPALVCLALATSEGLGFNVIGNVMQQNYEILYDTAASTIRFAPARCHNFESAPVTRFHVLT